MSDPTRRTLLVGTAAASVASTFPAPATSDARLFATLDATGPLLADVFHPVRALDAMGALLALPPTARTAALARYVAARPNPPTGLFAVIRALIVVPPRTGPAEPWPGVLQPGWLRPPALGAPLPGPPGDPTLAPRWPVLLLGDVPLVVVRGYTLAGKAEPLSMHLSGLASATWRTRPLVPVSTPVVREALERHGGLDRESKALLAAQLSRYAAR